VIGAQPGFGAAALPDNRCTRQQLTAAQLAPCHWRQPARGGRDAREL